jgi:hypothetical protein
MGHPEVAIRPYIRHVDGCPSKPSQLELGEVQGGNIVGVMLESAFHASEERLGSSIGSVDVSASWTGFRSVPWIDIGYWNSFFKSFVFDKELELSKSPTVEVSVLAFPMLSSIAYPGQFFHNNYVTLFKGVHELPADLMQNGVNPSSLLSTQPFQSAFGRLRAFGLERRAELSKTASFLKDILSFNLEAVRSDEKIVHSNIYANRVIAFRVWDLFVDGDMKEELLISVNQDCVGRLSVFEKISLVISYVKRRLNSLLDGRDRSIDTIRLVDKSEKPFIQVHRKLRELQELVSSLLVGFSDPVSGSYRKICREIKLLSRLSVNYVVESDWIEHSSFKSYLRNVVASVAKSLYRPKQLLKVFRRWLKFASDSLRELHFKKAYMLIGYLRLLRFLPVQRAGLLGGI